MKRILFMSGGAREKALEGLIASGEKVIAVITPLLTDKNNRFSPVILTAAKYGIPVYPVTKENLHNTIAGLNFDILISCGFSYVLEEKTINLAPVAINVHPTLLPQYRGFRSGPYVLINNELKSGVTVHYLTVGMDTGNIILQEEFPLSSFDTTKSVYRKVRELEARTVPRALKVLRDPSFLPQPQNESEATTFNQIRTPKDSEVDWTLPLIDLYNHIRACDPIDYPAFFMLNGEKVCIKLWRPSKPPDEEDMI